MKRTLLILFTILLSASGLSAQEITVNTSLGASYANQVYYKLSTETETSFAADSWDIAFLRTSAFDIGIRVNSNIEVFEAASSAADWNTIDVANEGTWTQLYNSDTNWGLGAFDQGSATYGWGEYNPSNHHVVGSIIFVLKYADGTYRKFINEDFYGGYSIKYATWDANTSTWSADVTATISNSSNPDNIYNYYSLVNEAEVVAEPADTDWDFVFTKYIDLGIVYPVTGVLHSADVTVAQNEEPSGMPANPTLTYSEDINVIGYDWKTFNMSTFSYDVDNTQAYYVKYADGTVYRVYFTAFTGSSTGDLSFNFENVTASLGINDINENVSFGLYPNPSIDKKINLVYDVNAFTNNQVAIYSVTGKKVYQTTLSNNTGFYNKTLDLSSLASGMYVLQFTSDNSSVSKKIILK